MRYCSKCRASITDTQLFCGRCWAPLSRSQNTLNEAAATALNSRPLHPRLPFLITIGVIFLLFFWVKFTLEKDAFPSEFADLSVIELDQKMKELSAKEGMPAFGRPELAQLRDGMSYEKVQTIIGSPGIRSSGTSAPADTDPNTITYAWQRLDGVQVECQFRDNRLTGIYVEELEPRREFYKYVRRR